MKSDVETLVLIPDTKIEYKASINKQVTLDYERIENRLEETRKSRNRSNFED